MKIEEGLVRQIKISEVEDLDPIRVVVEEYTKGEAKVIVECYGQSWSSYWGSMGGSIKEFFTRTNVDYLVNCFERGIRPSTGELDTDAMKETFVSKVRECVLERVKEGYTKSPANRDVYDECVEVSLDQIAPEHPYDCWNFEHYSMTEGSWEEVFYDKEFFTEWMENKVPPVFMVNHEYEYLYRIISVVRGVINGEMVKKEVDNV